MKPVETDRDDEMSATYQRSAPGEVVRGKYAQRLKNEGFVIVVDPLVSCTVECNQVPNGRWRAEVPDWPGVVAEGQSESEALARVQVLALRAVADYIEASLSPIHALSVSFILPS